ncbi:hypothetical protein AMTRI_Chr04g189680 [Amborella trichopoda]
MSQTLKPSPFLFTLFSCISFSAPASRNPNPNPDHKYGEINPRTILHLLKKCSDMATLKHIHSHMVTTGLISHTHIVNKLIFFCSLSSNGCLNYASLLCAQMPNPKTFALNTIMRGYGNSSSPSKALLLFKGMIDEGISIDNFTFTFSITACARMLALQLGQSCHGFALKLGFDLDIFVRNSLINLYACCGEVDFARWVFDGGSCVDSVSWNSIINAYAKSGEMEIAEELFNEMPERDAVTWASLMAGYVQNCQFDEALRVLDRMGLAGIEPNDAILTCALSACAHLGDLERGKQINASIDGLGVKQSVHLSTALVNMYAKCGKLDIAHTLFNKIPDRNVVSWSTMISGYACSDQSKEALDLFREMQANGVAPNEAILVTVLSVSANLGAFDLGKWVHRYIERNNIFLSANIGTALIHMYARCARLEESFEVFDMMREKNVDSWNAIISGLAMHGLGAKAMDCFCNMKISGIKPDDITFIGILSACSHSGLVLEGKSFYGCMTKDYNITPKVEHYGCMVDLLGRAGLLIEAQQLIESMPMKPDNIVWGALLGACKLHGDLELGEKVVNRVLELEPRDAATYVLISNIYAGAGRWGEVKKVRKAMREKGIKILPGWSSIEIEGIVHQFLVGDRSHSRSKEIYAMLEKIIRTLRLEGHSPDTKNVLHDVGEEEKEDALRYHSEKLAIAFGFIATRSCDMIYVVKNLRICGDCHSAMKAISRIFDREIIIRDRVRFHHFIDGSCSCMDYW